MLTFTILAILGALLAFVLFQMTRKSGQAKIPAAAPAPALGGPADLWSARKGDVVSITGAAADFSDVDFTVDRRGAYEANNRRWIELSGEFRGNRVYLEVQRGPEAEVMGLLDPRKLTLVDVGLGEDRLVDMDAKQDPSQTISFEGKFWSYESSREIGYFEDEQGAGEGVYRWLFREPNGSRLLCIEKWEGEPFDVRLAVRIKPSDITVYRAA